MHLKCTKNQKQIENKENHTKHDTVTAVTITQENTISEFIRFASDADSSNLTVHSNSNGFIVSHL